MIYIIRIMRLSLFFDTYLLSGKYILSNLTHYKHMMIACPTGFVETLDVCMLTRAFCLFIYCYAFLPKCLQYVSVKNRNLICNMQSPSTTKILKYNVIIIDGLHIQRPIGRIFRVPYMLTMLKVMNVLLHFTIRYIKKSNFNDVSYVF